MKLLFSLCLVFIIGANLTICLSQELPIKPARTISFTTDEGSYMSVDVSPDGKELLFDLLGDLYSVSSSGGDARQLTRGIALNFRPIWSPDGKRIAYISDFTGAFHLNITNLARSFHRVLGVADKELKYGTEAIWSPDGNYIAVGDILYAISGAELSGAISAKHPIRFSSDGRMIYGLDSGKIYVYERDTKLKRAISPFLSQFSEGQLSPNARWWCYIVDSNSHRYLYIQDLRNNTNRVLVPSLIEKDPRYIPDIPVPHFCFSPDSKDIFIGYGGKIHRIDVNSGNDVVIPFIAKVKADLGPLNYNTYRVTNDSLKVKYIRSVNASPDGKHIIFTALGKIFIMNLPKGKPRVLTPQNSAQYQPIYSPDGKSIAYVTWSDTAGGYLWRVPASGGPPMQLTHVPGQYQRPAWSPDGKLIAVVMGPPILGDRDDPGKGQLQIVPSEGGAGRVLDDSVPLWNELTFSADGQRVIYIPKYRRNRKSKLIPELVSKELGGGDFRIEAVGEDYTFYGQKIISPDRRYIVYSVDEDLYLIPACKITEPLDISGESQHLSVIRFAEGVDPCWEENGKVLAWTYGNRFYRINPEKVVWAAETANTEKLSADSPFVTARINPDEVIGVNIKAPCLYAHGMLALKDVRIITMQGNRIIEHGTIIIKDNRITRVGPLSKVFVPSGARVLNLQGTTVMPGIVDVHLHMRVPPNIFPQQSWMFLINLAYGVTTARDPSALFDSFGYEELLKTGGMIGPRLYTSGRPVRFYDGVIRLDNLEDARAVVKKRKELGGIVVKNYLELQPRLPREYLAIACREAGMNMTNEGWFDPLLRIGMLKDGSTGTEHNPKWGDIYKDIVTLMAKSGSYFTPTLQISSGNVLGEAKEYFKYKFWRNPNEKLRHFGSESEIESLAKITEKIDVDTANPRFVAPAIIDARIERRGGLVVLGSHGNDEGIGAQNEIWALQMGGLSNLEALREATIMGAKALGIQQDVGSIEPGKIADLIILNKNPLEDIHNSREIRYVMKDGILYYGNTLDMIWPVKKKCPEWKLRLAQ